MSWNKLLDGGNKERAAEAKARTAEERLALEQMFKRCFSTEDGEKVLQHLSQRFIYGNDVPLLSVNIDYTAAYKNGEAGLVKYIIHLLAERRDVRKEEA